MKAIAIEYCVRMPGVSACESIWNTVSMASIIEQLGYARLWLTEHHNGEAVHSSPEVLIAALAGTTSSIRIGSAGVLLGLHSPLRIANSFLALSALFPDRIDLGVARGVPTSSLDSDPLHIEFGEADSSLCFEEKILRLQHLFNGEASMRPEPRDAGVPPMWIVGTGETSVKIASEMGIPLCFGDFPENDQFRCRDMIEWYRSSFKPGQIQAPYVALAIAGFCSQKKVHEASAKRITSLMVEQLVTICKPDEIGLLETTDSISLKQDSYEIFQNIVATL